MKPTLFFLIGPPAVGKTWWLENNNLDHLTIINRDNMVKNIAKQTGIGTYDDMFFKVPKELVPPGMPTKEQFMDPGSEPVISDYMTSLRDAANFFNRQPKNQELIERYGVLSPFTRQDLERVIVVFGIPIENIVPFEFTKIRQANDEVAKVFDKSRIDAAESRNDVVLDMVNMSIQERDQHRKFFVAALEGIKPGAANPSDINKYYDQVAVLFAPEQGYTEDVKIAIKKVAEKRAAAAKLAGDSKTIPEDAYDRWFKMYVPPTPEEGFVQIISAGVPSLGLSERLLRKFIRTIV